jgi:hypothetical protein
MRRTLLPAALILFASSLAANAVGFKTQISCAGDYYAFCSSFPVGSPAVRKCMSDNGPKLSKSCINALIADGEISKEEVARRTANIAAVSAAPKPERKAVAQRPDEPKRDIIRQSDIKEGVKQQPGVLREKVTLDQPTFVALKNRGHHFLSDLDAEIPSASSQSENRLEVADDQSGAADQTVAGSEDRAEASTVATPVAESEKKAAGTVENRNDLAKSRARNLKAAPVVGSKPKAVATDNTKAAEMPAKPVKVSNYPPGKMSLGKKQSFVEVDAIKPASPKTWVEYMKSRFNGSMNYEGVDAHFAKGQ